MLGAQVTGRGVLRSQLMSATSYLADTHIPLYFRWAYLIRSYFWPLVQFGRALNWEQWRYALDFVRFPIFVLNGRSMSKDYGGGRNF